MDSHHGEESGKMYSHNEQGEYTPEDGAQALTVQGLADVLSGLESEDTVVEPPEEELILWLEVTMVDHPGQPRSPAFSWNAGMVMHVLKNYPTLRDLKYVQVDNPGTAYLFFLDKQCCLHLHKCVLQQHDHYDNQSQCYLYYEHFHI